MDSINDLCKNAYSYQDWLNYYLNIWNRNLVARTIDVETDILFKAQDPEQEVEHQNQFMPVKVRLEHRKILVQDAIDLLAGISRLAALSKEEYEKQMLSKEALAAAEDMLPPQQKVGDPCEVDGKPGTLDSDGKGGLVCVPTAEPAAKVDDAQADPAAPGVEEAKGEEPGGAAAI